VKEPLGSRRRGGSGAAGEGAPARGGHPGAARYRGGPAYEHHRRGEPAARARGGRRGEGGGVERPQRRRHAGCVVVVVVLGRSPSAEVVGGRLVCREVGEAGRERPRGARRGWSGVEARREGGRERRAEARRSGRRRWTVVALAGEWVDVVFGGASCPATDGYGYGMESVDWRAGPPPGSPERREGGRACVWAKTETARERGRRQPLDSDFRRT
jgi:hypothetical protein